MVNSQMRRPWLRNKATSGPNASSVLSRLGPSKDTVIVPMMASCSTAMRVNLCTELSVGKLTWV